MQAQHRIYMNKILQNLFGAHRSLILSSQDSVTVPRARHRAPPPWHSIATLHHHDDTPHVDNTLIDAQLQILMHFSMHIHEGVEAPNQQRDEA